MWVQHRPASLGLRKERAPHEMNRNGDPMKLTPWYLAAIAPPSLDALARFSDTSL
jgi:hypothetical protein